MMEAHSAITETEILFALAFAVLVAVLGTLAVYMRNKQRAKEDVFRFPPGETRVPPKDRDKGAA